MTRHYCTYFDSNFLARALALHDSLARHDHDFQIDVLCLDTRVMELLAQLRLPGVQAFPLSELIESTPGLETARSNRTWVEFVWTLTPALIEHSLRRHPEAEMVTYLDADLYFYSSPEPIFAALGQASIGLMPHRFVTEVAAQIRNSGLYNVGMMPFRRDARAAEALAWWREQCLAACHATARDGKFGDQKYLDDWPERFAGVAVIDLPGANLAPWNVPGHRLAQTPAGVTVDAQPLIFYHFHKLDVFGPHWYRCGVKGVSRQAVDLVYRPYFHALRRAYARIREVAPGFEGGIARLTPARIWQWFRYRRFHFIHEA